MSLPLPGFDPNAARARGPDGDWVVDPREPLVGAVRPNFQSVPSAASPPKASAASALGISLPAGLAIGVAVAAGVALLGKASK